MRKEVGVALMIVAGLSASVTVSARALSASDRIDQTGRWLTDREGRVVMIRGGNVMLPTFSENGEPRWTPDTPARMAEQGFNGIRLVIFFKDLMPRPGEVDRVYLERIARTVAAYKAAGVYTLIDFHQDQYGPLTGGRGMPDWAVFSDGHRRMPDISFPVGYFKDPAVQRSFDNFWKNHPVPGTGKGVQDFYVDGLTAVARRFRDESAVLGIDVMNEPSPGSRCVQADPAAANCPELEQELLKPFYAKVATALNRAAPKMILFYEPFMLQGALGIPIDTPIAGRKGRRGISFHNYGPVRATRAKVNGEALGVADRHGAAIINTEWGYSNDPAEVSGQAADFDRILVPWLAWTRGAFEALVDPRLPDRDNGNRVAILRSYARPYPEATAGVPEQLEFDPSTGSMTYRFATRSLRAGRNPVDTRIRVPAIQYPNGYRAAVTGGEVASRANAPILLIKSRQGAESVTVTVTRLGELPPLPVGTGGVEKDQVVLPAIPAGPLSRTSLLGHIVATPGGRELLEKHVPGMLAGLSHVSGWQKMTLAGIRQFAGGIMTDAKLAQMDVELATLPVKAGPVTPARDAPLSLDSLTSDLLADSRSRAILEKEAPGLAASSQRALFPQTTLRALQPAMPDILTNEAMRRIEAALAALK